MAELANHTAMTDSSSEPTPVTLGSVKVAAVDRSRDGHADSSTAHSHVHDHDHSDCEEEAACEHEHAEPSKSVLPGDIVELVPGAEDLYIVGTVDGFGKVTKIAGLEAMASLKVRGCLAVNQQNMLWID